MPAASRFFSTSPDRITTREEARFFGQLKTGNGTFKRTEPGRLDLVNGWMIEVIRHLRATPREVLDIGISSGVTSLELAGALHDAGFDARLTGTDRSFAATLVDLGPGVRVLAEPSGHILQYELLGMPVKAWSRRLDFVDGMAAIRLLLRRLLGARVAAAVAAGEGRPIQLVTPRLGSSGAFRLVEDDVTVRNPAFERGFDLVRAANILNRHYFTPAALVTAVTNVRSYLRGPGSLLLVVRTHGAVAQHGSLMRLDEEGRLRVVARCGTGSEVEDLFSTL
jgi:hypothetical protein